MRGDEKRVAMRLKIVYAHMSSCGSNASRDSTGDGRKRAWARTVSKLP